MEEEALHLRNEGWAQLIQRLILSLDVPSEEKLSSDWLPEARRRTEELESSSVQVVPHGDA